MSAESSRQRQASQIVVLPQPVTDKSIIDSVAGFIHEVVPPAYTNVLHGENKERITWARFERPDLFDPFIFSESADIDAYENAPLLLIVGYNVGAKIWSVSINGEATEVLSLTDSIIKCLRLLPTPLSCSVAESSRKQDLFAHKRSLIAVCDNAGSSVPFCLVNFISLRTGEQVKAIQFKTQVCDIQANRRSIAIVFPERIAVFDAFTLEDQLTVTTCFPSPSINPNPVALGSRWLAYAEKQLILQKRSRGGSEGEGVQSYTATVLQAAKTLSKGLREFSGSVTSSLTGTGLPVNGSNSLQPGIITILDVESSSGKNAKDKRGGEIIAHYIAHSEPIVAMNFDPSGMLLVTADKRGHRFHVFRINPHIAGSASASVHHLYILYRGDTTARVQDISFSNDSRWVAVSSLRGTTHVFPITPYGGSVGLRTHATPHVVNKLSRFHRSAGLTNDGRNSPILYECTQQLQMLAIPNPCLPPFPSPVVITPLAQLRTYPPGIPTTRGHEDVSAMIKVAACFAPPRAWLSSSQETTINSKSMKRAVDSLFIITCHANLIQYDLEPKHVVGVTKDRICDNTQIELGVEAKAEWPLVNSPSNTQPPLNASNPLLLISRPFISNSSSKYQNLDADERWLSQVEIVTHAGPHRRLWMGPQFTFKTFSSSSGGTVPVMDAECGSRLNRSSPVNMPLSHNPIVPVLLESGSSSSFEQSPCLLDMCGSELEKMEGEGDSRLQEDLADAMQEGPGMAIPLDAGGGSIKARASVMARQVNPLGTVITLSEGVSLAACIKTPDSNLKISKVVCCEEQSSHLPSSFDSPVNLDLSRTLSEPGTDLNVQDKIIYIDSTQSSSESNANSSSNSVDVNTNFLQMVTVVEVVSKTDRLNHSKISSGSIKAPNQSSDSGNLQEFQKDSENVSKSSEKRNISQESLQVGGVHETTSAISSKNLKSEPPKVYPHEEPSISSKPSKAKSKKEKMKGNKVFVESIKQEDPGEKKEMVQESSIDDSENSEFLLKTRNELVDISSTSAKSRKSDKSGDMQLSPVNLVRTSKKKRKETGQLAVNLPKVCKNVEISPKKADIPADTIIISTYSSEEEIVDEKFESICSEEQTVRQEDPVIIRSHGVIHSIFDEHFRQPSVLEDATELTKSELVPETFLENLTSDDKTAVPLPVTESCLEIPCYVEKISEEKVKPSTRNKKHKKGKASNLKENHQNLGKQDNSTSLSMISASDFSKETCIQNDEKDQDLSQSFSVEPSPDFVSNVSCSFPTFSVSDDQSYSNETKGDKTQQASSFEEDVGSDSVKSSVTALQLVSEKLNLVENDTSNMPIEPVIEKNEPQDTQLSVSSKIVEKSSKKRRGRKSKSNQSTVKEDVKVDTTATLSYAFVSKNAAKNASSETDAVSAKVPSTVFPENYDDPDGDTDLSGHHDNWESTNSSGEKSGSVQDDQFKSNLAPALDCGVDSPEPNINLKEVSTSVDSESIKLANDAEMEPLLFELQLNSQELNSLNEDFLSLTTEDLISCNVEDQKEKCDGEIKVDESEAADLTEQLLLSNLIDSGSDFFIPHPLCSDDESGVDYVQITSMIVEDNLCQEDEPEETSDNPDTLEPKPFDFSTNDADADFTESNTLEASSAPESATEFTDKLLESAEKPLATAVDDPLKISELMCEPDDFTVSEPCLAESVPTKKEATPTLPCKKNRKEKGKKGRGRR